MHAPLIHHWSAAAVGGASVSRNTRRSAHFCSLLSGTKRLRVTVYKWRCGVAGPGGRRSEVSEACAACEEDMLKVQGQDPLDIRHSLM